MRTHILALFLILQCIQSFTVKYDVKQWAFCRCPLTGWGSSRLLPVCWVFLPWKAVGVCQKHSVQLLSRVWLFATPQTVACQASLSFTISWILLKLMSIESAMPSNYLILCHPLLLLPSIFPSIRVFSNESALRIRWPKYWNFSFNISPSNEYSGLISFRIDWFDLLAVQGTTRVFSTVQKHPFFSAQLSSQSNFHIHTWPLEEP